MSRLRPLVSALAALMLLVQSFAVAAAPVAKQGDAMPCAASMADHQKSSPCCDATHCPDMASCMLGSFVSSPFSAPQFHREAQAPVQVAARLAPAATPQRLFRPPIALHA